MDATGASEEIEQTLQLARQEAERRIALYRVWVFGFIFAASGIIAVIFQVTGKEQFLIAPVLWGGLLLYGLGLKSWIDRFGASTRLAYVSIVADLVGVALTFLIAPRRAESNFVILHVAVPTFVLILVCHLLRSDGRVSIIGGATAALLIPPVLLRHEPLNPIMFSLPIGVFLVGVIGWATARQTRRNLENHARLQLLRRYLSPQAVERVMLDNPDAALSLGGRLVTVTLLATDLRGFTAMSEKLAPGEVVAQLNAYHGAMLAEVRKHGGVLDKFIGDGALVIFGLPVGPVEAPPDCGAGAAVACARDMLAALEKHNTERAKEGHEPLRMGLGIHTGPVVAGNIGAPGQRLEFTVIGDAVNTASRLETLTKEAHTPLLISSATVDRLGDAKGLRELEPMHAKGKETPLRVFAPR